MEQIDEKVFVEHGIDITVVTFNHKKILSEQYLKELEKELMSVVEKARRQNMVLDFCNVKFMTSAFLGLLVKMRNQIRERGGYLKLQNIDPSIYKIFEITKLTKIFDIS
ncbi:MAG: STAS domain-containing protein [Planctomycetes bacterium]|nr:STAS domain-containing protein [Planctomycetota bacterium]